MIAQIRRATLADAPTLSKLIRGSFADVAQRFGLTPENAPTHPSNCADEWIEDDLSRGVTYLKLVENETLHGCVAVERASREVCYLERLAVLPEFRGRGDGGRLAEAAIDEARGLGAGTVSIGIIAAHTELKEWYAKRGFIEGDTVSFAHLPFDVTYMTYGLA